MGLDMYAYTVPASVIGDQQVDLNDLLKDEAGETRKDVNTDFAYWRKFNHLHGWMHNLYNSKGGSQESFNCTTVRLMPEDIDRLESDMNNHLLQPTAGFFFGDEELYPEDIEGLQQFIQKSREAFKDDLAVLYDSWW